MNSGFPADCWGVFKVPLQSDYFKHNYLLAFYEFQGVHTSQSLDDGSYASISFVSFSPIVVLFLASCKE